MADLYLAVTVDEETYERLATLAREKGRDVPSLIRDALRLYLVLSEPLPARPRLVRPHDQRL